MSSPFIQLILLICLVCACFYKWDLDTSIYSKLKDNMSASEIITSLKYVFPWRQHILVSIIASFFITALNSSILNIKDIWVSAIIVFLTLEISRIMMLSLQKNKKEIVE